jgi:hypothetical protein
MYGRNRVRRNVDAQDKEAAVLEQPKSLTVAPNHLYVDQGHGRHFVRRNVILKRNRGFLGLSSTARLLNNRKR